MPQKCNKGGISCTQTNEKARFFLPHPATAWGHPLYGKTQLPPAPSSNLKDLDANNHAASLPVLLPEPRTHEKQQGRTTAGEKEERNKCSFSFTSIVAIVKDAKDPEFPSAPGTVIFLVSSCFVLRAAHAPP